MKICAVSICLSVLILTGCNQRDPVAMVKNSTLNIDNSTTIGNAFDNYKYFTGTTWDYGEDAQKRRIVTFTGKYDLESFVGASGLDIIGVPEELTQDMVNRVKQENPDLQYDYLVQFKISADENSFEVGYHGFNISGLSDANMRKDFSDDDGSGIDSIYKNIRPGAVVKHLLFMEASSGGAK